MNNKAIEILIRMIREIDNLRGFTFYKDQYETPPFVEKSEMVELHSLLNNNKMPEQEKVQMLIFEDVVKNNMEANAGLWKVIQILLSDVNELKKKFIQLEEAETKSI